MNDKLNAYLRLVRMDKPIGSLLLLWPTLWALWIASGGSPSVKMFFIFVLGTLFMRSAGCAVNDWADRGFDGAVQRTSGRPLVTGEITPSEALWVALACALLACCLLIPLNNAARLWALPSVLVASIYPFTKRFFSVPQAVLGVAFSMGVPMAFAAVQGHVPPVAWWLMAANWFWVLAYDTEYAMVDREDDVLIGIRTSAVFFGQFDVRVVAGCYGLFVVLMSIVCYRAHLGKYAMAGIFVALLLAIYHLWLIKDRDREKCFTAFRANNWLGCAVFVGLAADYALRAV